MLECLWLRSEQSRGRLHDGGLVWGPDFGAVLTPQIHGSLSIFGSGAGKVVDVLHDRGWSGSTRHEAKIDAPLVQRLLLLRWAFGILGCWVLD